MPNNYIASVTLYSSTPFPSMWPYNSCGMNMMNKSANRCVKNDSQNHMPHAWPMSYPAARLLYAAKYQKNNHIIVRKWNYFIVRTISRFGTLHNRKREWEGDSVLCAGEIFIFVFMLRCQSSGLIQIFFSISFLNSITSKMVWQFYFVAHLKIVNFLFCYQIPCERGEYSFFFYFIWRHVSCWQRVVCK